jgi:predicted RNase H-like HicB family nuclease
MKLTFNIQKGDNGWYIGQIEEIPAVIDQGKSIDELKKNLLEALEFYLDTQRLLFEEQNQGKQAIKESLVFA